MGGALRWLGLATSLPVMTLAGAYIGYFLAVSTGQKGIISGIGVALGAFAGFFLSLFELWSYARKESNNIEKEKTRTR